MKSVRIWGNKHSKWIIQIYELEGTFIKPNGVGYKEFRSWETIYKSNENAQLEDIYLEWHYRIDHLPSSRYRLLLREGKSNNYTVIKEHDGI